ncbi:MAG: non-hydrolyzing UDP-N-acetylglucosamine 2-epimerase [Anaerolineae bacterium]|jgi:UDP-N-acetylglucosamine 2-epimerase (non-hydrolysing)
MRVLSVLGTRPEAIKLAPVVRELARRPEIQSRVCVTGQHREMLVPVLDLFKMEPDVDLQVMRPGQTPTQVAAAVLAGIEPVLADERPDWVLVQGDTTTVAAAAWAAYYARIRVGHVEAGLRTGDKWQPFPEEVNRRMASVVADLHLAPTEQARLNLVREGIAPEAIVVTGNPVIDAMRWAAELPCDLSQGPLAGLDWSKRIVVVTAHRRENHGEPLRQICLALRDIAQHHPDVAVVYPVHPNPNVLGPVEALLGGVAGVHLLAPLDYLAFVHLLKRSYLVLTDSGGIQEEAPGLGKPVLVLRNVTERPEALAAGTARLVGTERPRVVREVTRLLEDEGAYLAMARAANPYGDGHAAERIVDALLGYREPGAVSTV